MKMPFEFLQSKTSEARSILRSELPSIVEEELGKQIDTFVDLDSVESYVLDTYEVITNKGQDEYTAKGTITMRVSDADETFDKSLTISIVARNGAIISSTVQR